MRKKIAFTDDNRDTIIAEQEALGFRLYEEQRHFDGWWLLFTDEPYVEPPKPEIPVFDPPPGTGMAKKVEYLEQFLGKLYPKEVKSEMDTDSSNGLHSGAGSHSSV